jgi:CheY-like chemotaxis protein
MRRIILLADDSPTIQRLVTNTFADGHFDIVSVSNGDAAIRKFEEVRPSVVLADIYMPGKNGYEVCAYVRQHPSMGGTPVVLLVGAFDAFDEEKAKQAGATSNITKPFEPQALVALVESVIPVNGPEPAPQEAPAPAVVPAVAEKKPEPPPAFAEPGHVPGGDLPVSDEDLLGLQSLFIDPAHQTPTVAGLSEQDIERIADRVIQKVSTQVIESIAWEVLPDISEKIVREEFKRHR